jgi:hypothetical protein
MGAPVRARQDRAVITGPTGPGADRAAAPVRSPHGSGHHAAQAGSPGVRSGKDQDSTSAVTPSPLSNQPRAAACARDPEHSGQVARAVGGAQLLMLRWLVGRRRVTGVALAAAGWAATFAAVIVGSHLGRGAAVQIIFAATVITVAMGETLLSPAVPVIIDDRAPPGAAGRYKRLGTLAFVTSCVLGPPVGSAAPGADWGTSLLTTFAVACAVASIAAKRVGPNPGDPGSTPGRHPAGSCRTEQLPPAKQVRVRSSQMEVDHAQP